MKNKINNKLLILTAISAIGMNGCVSKTIEVSETSSSKVKISKWKDSQSKTLATNKKDDCVDCYVTIAKKSPKRRATLTDLKTVYSYSKVSSVSDVKLEEYINPYQVDTEDKESNPYLVDASYQEESSEYENMYAYQNNVSSKNVSTIYSNKKAIQVGAFRKYAGAKVYAKRYSLLTSQYNVKIKENVKNNKPIYRVQIEGFSNQNEAKKFMARYGLNGAFLVRK